MLSDELRGTTDNWLPEVVSVTKQQLADMEAQTKADAARIAELEAEVERWKKMAAAHGRELERAFLRDIGIEVPDE